MGKKLNISGRILGGGQKTGRKWEIMAIKAGLSHNFSEEGARYFYSAEMLKEAMPLFNGVDVYAFEFKSGYFDHAPDSIAETKFQKGLIKNKVGQISSPRWGKDAEGNEGIVCDLTLVDTDIADTLRESWESGLEDFAGYSIDGAGPYELQEMSGVQVASVKIEQIDSVDIVTSPAAGGKNLRLVAATQQKGKGSNMNPKLFAALSAALMVRGKGAKAVSRLIESSDDKITDVAAEELKREADAMTAEGSAKWATLAKEAIGLLQEGRIEECMVKLQEIASGYTAPAAPVTESANTEPAKPDDATIIVKALADKISALETSLNEGKLTEALSKENLPQTAKERISEALSGRPFDASKFTAMVSKERDYLSALGVGGGDVRITASATGQNDANLALLGFFLNDDQKDEKGRKVKKFTSIREAKIKGWSGSWEEPADEFLASCYGNGFDSRKRLKEALSSSSWSTALGDAMSKALLMEYSSPEHSEWRLVSDVVPVKNFKTQNLVRVGGYGAIPTVAEGGTYLPLTSPTSEAATFSISKKGGLESVTVEAIANDDMRTISRIPGKLARSCKLGLYRAVFDLFAENSTCTYDTTALFHANHSNIGSTALSDTTLFAGRQAMMDQAAYNESRNVLGMENLPKYLLVPNELEQIAYILTQSDRQFAGAAASGAYAAGQGLPDSGAWNIHKGLTYLTIPYWTDANNWYLVADPKKIPVITVGFWNGNEEPELFTEVENSGSHFTADKMTWKIRFTWGVCIDEHRGAYGAIVA